jgi:hypothetical protein
MKISELDQVKLAVMEETRSRLSFVSSLYGSFQDELSDVVFSIGFYDHLWRTTGQSFAIVATELLHAVRLREMENIW